jgi:UDP-glucose 4-epimerase
MNILVTGGSGYIGSHLCVELLQLGYKVTVLDNLCNSQISALNNVSKIVNIKLNLNLKKLSSFNFCKADIQNIQEIEKIFLSQSFNFVIHLAGLKSVKDSFNYPKEYISNNVDGTKNLINTMKKFGCKNIIFSSSATIYGNSKEVPIKEIAPQLPTNPYAESKSKIEGILKKTFEIDNTWRIAILRFFNPIGAHNSGIIGENSNNIPNNLMPYILKVASGEIEFLNVYGNDYETHDGTGVRDYIHVLDIVSANLKALNFLKKTPNIVTVNLGTGVGYSVLDVIKAFEKASGKKIPFNFTKRREGDTAISLADATYAEEIFEWKAKYNLVEMCNDSWNYSLINQKQI